jgi:hypothetical protein
MYLSFFLVLFAIVVEVIKFKKNYSKNYKIEERNYNWASVELGKMLLCILPKTDGMLCNYDLSGTW